ncbi:hypothetical protein AB9F43_17645 [Rhizobium leguminosarum]|uniref:hypothetical protein n=1 Tax=Rhizobium leguminosarum TaxID=384 RepID=UPI0004A499D3|nr:hypothetical protein [Rhizobium leguminosarum]
MGDIVNFGYSLLATAGLAVGLSSCAIPPLRNPTDFPKSEVFRQIKCELYKAVADTENAQKLAYPDTIERFELRSYGATLALGEKSTRKSGGSIGGGVNNLTESRSFALGSQPFPGFSLSFDESQSDTSKRQILFSDILREKHSPPIRGTKKYLDTCNATPVQNPSKSSLPIGQPLGIGKRLAAILEEVHSSPGTVDEEEMNFDFTVTVGAGGTVSLSYPTRSLDIGGGLERQFNETLKITMTRVAKS